jgi:hypothetical protein
MDYDAMFYSYFTSPAFTMLPNEQKIEELKYRISNLELGQRFATAPVAAKEAGKVKLDYLRTLLSEVKPQAGGRKRKHSRKTRKTHRKVRKTHRKH